MEIFLAAFVVFAIAILAMAVGVIVGNRRLRGTCGGLAGLQDSEGQALCEACTKPTDSCSGIEEGKTRSQEKIATSG